MKFDRDEDWLISTVKVNGAIVDVLIEDCEFANGILNALAKKCIDEWKGNQERIRKTLSMKLRKYTQGPDFSAAKIQLESIQILLTHTECGPSDTLTKVSYRFSIPFEGCSNMHGHNVLLPDVIYELQLKLKGD
ncbi:MAG: hypothetical protein R3C03_21310 [Pirellulaceae bacterium]